MSKKVLVTGSRGQLGSDLVAGLKTDYEVVGVDIEDLDITDEVAVKTYIEAAQPDIVIHSAAYTDVDGCESNYDLAMAVNAFGTIHLARACHEIGAKMVYYSTDYVFDGRADRPYREDDVAAPRTFYGRSKWEGEKGASRILEDLAILRIAWLYGRHGRNFVKTMIRMGKEQLAKTAARGKPEPLKIVDDQIGNPTWTMEIVRQTKAILDSDEAGLFHCTSEGEATWYQFARDIFAEAGLEVSLEACRTEDYPRPAPRPHYSVLENARLKELGLNRMQPYREALKQFFAENGDIFK